MSSSNVTAIQMEAKYTLHATAMIIFRNSWP